MTRHEEKTRKFIRAWARYKAGQLHVRSTDAEILSAVNAAIPGTIATYPTIAGYAAKIIRRELNAEIARMRRFNIFI